MAHESPIDSYLAALPADQREALQRVRRVVARIAPDATESISYGMPCFKLHGRGLVWIAGWKAHCSIYPLTDDFAEAHAAELRAYRRTKGSLHFTPTAPLPETLLEHLIRDRMADVGAGRNGGEVGVKGAGGQRSPA